MPTTVIQNSFAGGEVSPALYARSDMDRYSISCRTLRNWLVKSQGPAKTRPGIEFINAAKSNVTTCRLIQFKFNLEQVYTIEFGNYYCRFYKNGGLIEHTTSTTSAWATSTAYVPYDYVYDGTLIYRCISAHTSSSATEPGTGANWATYWVQNAIYEIASPYLATDLKYINVVQSNDVLFIACKGYRPKELTRTAHTSWAFSNYSFSYGPYMNYNSTTTTITPSATTGTITLTASSAIFNSGHVGSWWMVGAALDSDSNDIYTYGCVKITAYTSSTVVTAKVYDTLAATTATSTWAEGSWSDYRGWPSCVIFFQDRLIWGCSDSEPQTWWASNTGDYVNFVTYSPLQDTDSITSNFLSRELNDIRYAMAIDEIIFLTGASEWIVGPASSGGSFTPSTAHQMCQGYRGTTYVNPVIVGNRIIYVQPKGTIVRDLGYSYDVDGYTGDDLTLFSRHLFEGHKITKMAYQQEPDSIVWMVRDDGILLSMTYLREQKMLAWARHDTDGTFEDVCCISSDDEDEIWFVIKRDSKRYIERLTTGITPDDVQDCFCVDCGLKYDKPLTIEKISLANPIAITITGHGLSNGDLIDISDITWESDWDDYGNETQPDQLNTWRYRVANATTNTFTLQDEDGNDIGGTSFNAYVSGGYVRKTVTTISGLDHLEGKTVAVLANGFVVDDLVVSRGQITLENAASRVTVGLPYICDLETMDTVFQTQTGAMQNKKVKIVEVTFSFDKSRGGWYGPDSDNLQEIIQRNGEASGIPIALITDESNNIMNSGFEDGGRVFFRQIDPLPVTILSVVGDVQLGG